MKALQKLTLKPFGNRSTLKSAAQYFTLSKDKNESEKSKLPYIPLLSSSAIAASSTPNLVTTAAGYTMSPIMVTALANAPLLAFAFVQAAGLDPIKQILKKKDTGKLSPLPFLSLFTNCANWSLYGYLVDDPTILIANVIGTIFGGIYTGIFWKNTQMNMLPYFIGSSAILSVMLSSPIWLGSHATDLLGMYALYNIYNLKSPQQHLMITHKKKSVVCNLYIKL